MNSGAEFRTEQEAFWAGSFGTEYISRNQGERALASNLALFARALRRAQVPRSVIEFGANIGLNLDALRILYPGQEQHAIEINSHAVAELRTKLPSEHVLETSILDYAPPATRYDLVLIKGVLIHINPERLEEVYDKLFQSTGRYLLVCEYYNPTPVCIEYRGHSERLFKRDFAGEILNRFQELRLVDYGFVYHRDTAFPQDDLTWFLLETR